MRDIVFEGLVVFLNCGNFNHLSHDGSPFNKLLIELSDGEAISVLAGFLEEVLQLFLENSCLKRLRFI